MKAAPTRNSARRGNHVRQRALGRLILLFICSFSQVGYSQQMPEPDKYTFETSGGVNLYDQTFTLSSVDIAVGSGEFPSRIELVRKHSLRANFLYEWGATVGFALGSRHSLAFHAHCFPCNDNSGYLLQIYLPETQVAFQRDLAVESWSASHFRDGATLIDAGGRLEVRTKSGTRIVFAPKTGPNAVTCGTNCQVPVLIENTAGDFLVYQYQSIPSPSGGAWSRITSVVNSKGFGLNFFYLNPSATSGDLQARSLVSRIQAFRIGCVNSSTVNCNAGQLPEVQYGYTVMGTDSASGNKIYRLTSFTNAAGVTFNYAYDSPQFFMTSMWRADNPSVKYFTNTYELLQGENTGRVQTQTDASGRTTTYNRIASGIGVVAPDGGTTEFRFGQVMSVPDPKGSARGHNPQPRFIRTPVGHEYEYVYDGVGRLVRSIDPEGNLELRTLDDRSNIVELRRIAKPNSGLSDIVSTQSFPACTATNYRICNRPTYTVDARGARTDFLYSEDHGGTLATLAPPDETGRRAVRRLAYQSFYPVAGLTAPPGVTLPNNWKQVADDECLTSDVAGTAVDFSYVCPAASRIRTTWRYVPSSSSSRSSHDLEAVIVDDGGLALQTRYSYDRAGNVISETSPKAFAP